MIRVLYFGPLRTITSLPKEVLTGIKSLEELKSLLLEKYPKLSSAHFVFSVNQKITEACSLKENDEVALLPPFSGG